MSHNSSSLGSRILPHSGWSQRYPLWLKTVCDSWDLPTIRRDWGLFNLWGSDIRDVFCTPSNRDKQISHHINKSIPITTVLLKKHLLYFSFFFFQNLLYFIFLHCLCPVSISETKVILGGFKYLQLWIANSLQILWHDCYNDNYTKNQHFISSFDSQDFMSVVFHSYLGIKRVEHGSWARDMILSFQLNLKGLFFASIFVLC